VSSHSRTVQCEAESRKPEGSSLCFEESVIVYVTVSHCVRHCVSLCMSLCRFCCRCPG